MNETQEYKSGELARALNVNPNTVRSWADNFREFMSDRATANKRSYTPEDYRVLATVADFRTSGLSFDAIREALDNGQRVDTLPDIPTSKEVERKEQEGIVLQSEYEGLQAQYEQEHEYRQHLESQLAIVTQKRDELQQRLETETSDIRQQWRTEVDSLNQQIIDLEREKSLMEGQLKIIQSERKPAGYWLQIIAGVVVVMVIIAAVVVVYMSSGVG